MEFPLKPGRVTLARLSQATGEYRLVAGAGEMQTAPMSYSGTSGVLRFDRPAQEVLDTVMAEGLDHHISLTYGDHLDALLASRRACSTCPWCASETTPDRATAGSPYDPTETGDRR